MPSVALGTRPSTPSGFWPSASSRDVTADVFLESVMSTANVKHVVTEKYGEAAVRARAGDRSVCCGGAPATLEACCDPITSNLYDAHQEGEVPEAALRASLGCGNPT